MLMRMYRETQHCNWQMMRINPRDHTGDRHQWRKLIVASMAGISFTGLPDISKLRQGAHCNTDKIAV